MPDNQFRKTIRSYKKKSIFIKQLYIILLVIVIPTMIIYSVFAFHFNKNYSEKLVSNARFDTSGIKKSYNASIDGISNLYSVLSVDKKIQSYLLTDIPINSIEVSEYTTYIFSLISSLSYNNIDFIDSIYIYKPLNDYVISIDSSNYLNLFQDKDWYDLYIENGKQDFMQTRVLHNYRGSTSVYTYVRNISIGSSPIGVIVLNIDISQLYNYLKSNYNYIDDIYIASPDGKIIISDDSSLIGTDIDNLSYGKVGINKNHIITKIEDNDFTIVTDFVNPTSNQSVFIGFMLVFIFVILFLGLFLISYIVSKRFYQNILDIIQILNENSDTMSVGISSNEFQYIKNNIFTMQRDHETAEKQLAESLAKLKYSQMQTLQNQINPHFIFNTLNLILLKDRIENNEQTNISRIVLLLSDILRPLFSSPNYITSFETEIGYLEKYITLQNIKYKNRFNLKINRQSDIKNPIVLSFSFQPIAENAISHGILPLKNSDGTIEINMQKSNDTLIIKITNYGSTLSQSRINQLNSDINDENYRSKHIGLHNVNQRIKLTFGKQYGVRISSGASDVTVTYTVPYTEYEDFTQNTQYN